MVEYPKDGFYQGICLFCGNQAGEKFFSGSRESYDVCDCEKRKLAELAASNCEIAWKIAHDRYDEILRQRRISATKGELNSLMRQSNEYKEKNGQ
jgi:uncharacterized protein YehS (DUF1456 family)